MKTDCVEFNDCRLPVSVCNGKCKLYQPVRKTYKGSKKRIIIEKKGLSGMYEDLGVEEK